MTTTKNNRRNPTMMKYASDAMEDDMMRMDSLPAIEEIKNGRLTMFPYFRSPIKNRDYRYVLSLARRYKFNIHSDEKLEAMIRNCVRYMWEVWLFDVRVGVEIFMFIPEVCAWTFDAYRDDQLMKCLFNDPMHTLTAGKMALDWFEEKKIDEKIFTTHDIRSRAATLMCLKLGFKKVATKKVESGDYIVLRKDF